MGDMESYLRPVDVAKYTGLSLEGVRKLIDAGELETVEMNGLPRVRKTEIDRWLDEQVDADSLIELARKLKEKPDAEQLASMLGEEVEEVEEKLAEDE